MYFVTVDLDGTIANSSFRKAIAGSMAWHKEIEDDVPNNQVVELMAILDSIGVQVFIVTGKPESFRAICTEWLDRYGITPIIVGMFMRPDDNNERTHALKINTITNSTNKSITHLFHLDDDGETILAMRNMHIAAIDVADIASNTIPINQQVKKQSVGDMLMELRDVFNRKQEEYGATHERHGNIMASFFPDGITLKTPSDFYLYHIFDLKIVKSNRIATAMSRDRIHKDSFVDDAIYSCMAVSFSDKEEM